MDEIQLSGYEDSKQLMAQRYNRGGKSLFVIALPLHLIATHMPIPDPEQPFEGNRRVDLKHATDFARYWRANSRWATPPLLLDTTYPLAHDFEARLKVAGVEFGVAHLPHNSAAELQILDGQHRILGWTIAARDISLELKKAREGLLSAKENEDPISIQVAEAKVADLAGQQKRLRDEYVTVEILEGVSLADHKQYFHDIATNAKGITKSLTASFDRRKMENRVAVEASSIVPLLKGRVDFEKTNAVGQSPNLISGKNLVDIVKALAVGPGAQFTPRKEKEINEVGLTKITGDFFALLTDSFPDLAAVRDDDVTPAELRSDSMLGSPTIVRMLAGAYFGVAIDSTDPRHLTTIPAGQAKVRILFKQLAPFMELPLAQEWFDTGFFPERTSRAPLSNTQTLKGMTELLTRWAQSGSVFV